MCAVRLHPARTLISLPQSARDRRIAERRAQRKEEREYARKEEYARRCRAQVRIVRSSSQPQSFCSPAEP